MENSREEAKPIEDDLADAVNEIGLMLSDGNNLRSNFAANQEDDGSDKSLEFPGSLETDLAKDIDRWAEDKENLRNLFKDLPESWPWRS